MNGNRYCVVDVGDEKIPGTIMVLNIQTQRKVPVHLRYKGQQWWCRRYDEYHVRVYEFLKKFHDARELRAKEQINVRIMSDSTLRLAESVDLRADVLCMSGGGVGHLVNAVREDPAMKETNEVVLVTSGNDLCTTSIQVCRSCKWLSPRRRIRMSKFCMSEISRRPPSYTRIWRLKSSTLSRNCSSLPLPRLMSFLFQCKEVEMDDSVHPTEGDTLTILGAQRAV